MLMMKIAVAFADKLTWCPARDHALKEQRPGELSPGRNSSMIKGYVKGARNVNCKCESGSHFGEFIVWNVSKNCALEADLAASALCI